MPRHDSIWHLERGTDSTPFESQWLTFAPVPASSAAYFQVTESEINWYSTATLLCIAASAPVVIYTLRHGPKPAIFAASALVLAGNWIRYGGSRASSGSYGIVMFGQILIAIAQALVLASPARYSDLWFTDRGRVAATAVMSLANAFGAALGSLIIPFMVEAPEDVPNMLLWLSVIVSLPLVENHGYLPELTYESSTAT